ncbi:MAG: Rpn family recombination-promoting nuclease/putative transposase [Magnetococcus sp. WYHC-3]
MAGLAGGRKGDLLGVHDSSYKQLFSHAEMIRDLLQGFVDEAWVAQVDFASLEKVNGSYIADDLREREDDVIWRVRWGREWLYVYLLLEFQSSQDWSMSVRMTAYVMLLYQDLIKSGQVKQGEFLPPVLPVVLYNGKPPWSAARDVAELIAPVGGWLDRFRPHMSYLLIDEVRYGDAELMSKRNLVAALFRLEKSRSPTDIRAAVGSLLAWLKAPEQMSLLRAFTVMLGRVLLPRKVPGQPVPELNDLQEVDAMLAETVQEWTMAWEAKGRQEGRQEGHQEGHQEGRREEAADILLQLLPQRFGPLPPSVAQRVSRASLGELELWTSRIFSASALEEIFVP